MTARTWCRRCARWHEAGRLRCWAIAVPGEVSGELAGTDAEGPRTRAYASSPQRRWVRRCRELDEELAAGADTLARLERILPCVRP